MAKEIKVDCEGPFGAVRLLDLPSWFTKDATMLTELANMFLLLSFCAASVIMMATMASARP